MKSPTIEETSFYTLQPYDPREGIGLRIAADRAGKSESTVRGWCARHGLGRRVGIVHDRGDSIGGQTHRVEMSRVRSPSQH